MRFNRSGHLVTGLPIHAVAIVPSDTVDLTTPLSVYVGVAGNVKVTPAGAGAAVTFVSASAGSVLPVQVMRVWATGTSAGSLVGIY